MSTESKKIPAIPKPAATILLLRERPDGMEVLMVTRHHQIDFASGALVFPGGKVCDGDRDERVRTRCTGIDGLSGDAIALQVAAIREAFEESGLLLARRRNGAALVDADTAAEVGSRYRRRLDSGEIGIQEMLDAEDLVLACEELTPFAHWITPTFVPKRFDTYFYLAAAPAEQIAVHDGKEAVDSVWIKPQDALAQTEGGQRTMLVATKLNVRRIGESATIAGAVQAARSQRIVTVLPELIERAGQRRLRIPLDAGYGESEIGL